MAEKRTIHRKISLSEAVDVMTTEAQLLFTWSIPHADDVGILPRSAKTLKGVVFPLKEITADEVEDLIEECLARKLYSEFKHNEKHYLLIRNFNEHQTLRRDRQPQTMLDIPMKQKPQQNWDLLDGLIEEGVTDTRQSSDGHRFAEVKGSEVKGSEGKTTPRASKKSDDQKEKDIYDVPFFNEFWEEYPKKVGKGQALRSWKKLKPSQKLGMQIIASVVAHRDTQQWQEQNGRFIPNPATFLNQRRFDDPVDQKVVDEVSSKYAHLS